MSPRRNPLHSHAPGPRPAAECIPLDALAERARALDALDQRLRRLLPAATARETRLADVRNGRVVFLASSPTWASRLRLHQSAILAEARAALGDGIERFAVKVAPLPTVPPEPTKPKPLSAATARHLMATATILSDPELQALYRKLASIADDDSNA
ncbi:MAG TPA: DciA family protein [Dokdonella sp.]